MTDLSPDFQEVLLMLTPTHSFLYKEMMLHGGKTWVAANI